MTIQLHDLPLHLQEQARRQMAVQAGGKPDASPPADLTLTAAPDEKRARKVDNRERWEQIEYMDRVRACRETDPVTKVTTAHPGREGAELIFALANESAGGKGIGVLRWKMGVLPGLPDIGVFVPRTFYPDTIFPAPGGKSYQCPGLFIELKTSGGVASDVRESQRAVHDGLRAAGYKVAVCYGWQESWRVTCEYLGWEAT